MGLCGSRPDYNEILAQNFEKNLPFTKISLQDYEERVKRLVFEEDQGFVTLK
jgi:hypothetical protein